MDRRQERRDQSHRRRAWRVLFAVAVLGIVLLVAFDAWLRHVVDAGMDDPDGALRQLGLVSLLVNLGFAAVGALLAYCLLDWARQTREQGQWPPAGLQLLGNPPTLHGQDARRVAGRLRKLALLSLLLAAAMLGWTAWKLLA